MAEDANSSRQHTVAEVQSVIEGLMSRLNATGHYDSTFAERLAGSLLSTVNDPKNAFDNLIGNTAFERLVTEQAPTLGATVNGQASQLAAARGELARANVAGDPLSDATRSLLGIQWRRHGEQLPSGSDGDRGSSARYDSMGSVTDYNSPAGQAQMRELAVKSGVGWAANNPDLLRLGPSAIQALADVHLREDSYKRLKGDLKFDDKTIVNGARYMKRTGGDYNALSETATEANKALAPADQDEHRKALGRLLNCKPGADQDEAQKNFNDVTKKIEGHSSPRAKELLGRERELLHTQVKEEKKAEVKAEAKETQATKVANAADDILGDLNGPAATPALPAKNPQVAMTDTETPASSPEKGKDNAASPEAKGKKPDAGESKASDSKSEKGHAASAPAEVKRTVTASAKPSSFTV